MLNFCDFIQVYVFSTNHHFQFCLHSQAGSTLKGKNLLPMEQILIFKSRPYFGRVLLSREAGVILLYGGKPIHVK